LLEKKFLEISHKIYGSPEKIALAYKTLTHNIKEDDVKIYFGLRYGIPNKMKLTLNNLPDNDLGKHLKKLARGSVPLVLRSLGASFK